MQFKFDQQKTKFAELLKCTISLFGECKHLVPNSRTSQLLLIVSDGRGVDSEGDQTIQRAVLALKELNIFSVFLIIDNPEHKHSILDIRVPIFRDGKCTFESYIDKFPFPFYVILKDINSLPSILGEALRQWFELVTNDSQTWDHRDFCTFDFNNISFR